MLSFKKTLMSCFLIASLVVSSLPALAETSQKNPKSQVYPDKEEKTSERMIVDTIAARPIGLVATLGGAVVFLVSWPFSALGGNSDEAWNTLVAEPAVYTFQRPLGDFEE